MQLGTRIRVVREARGLKGKDLAKKARVSPPEISRLEKNQLKNPTVATLAKIANALEVAVDFLLGLEDENLPLEEALAHQSFKIFLKANVVQDHQRAWLEKISHLPTGPQTEK